MAELVENSLSFNERENMGKMLGGLSGDLQVIMNLFEVLTRSPDVITPDILEKAKEKIQGILTKVQVAEKQVYEGPESALPKLQRGEAGSVNPVVLLDGVLAEFESQLNTSMALSPDQISTLSIPDSDFKLALRTLFDSAVETQSGIHQKTCEVSIGTSGSYMILKFKDFGRSIPEEELDGVFSANSKHSSRQGYPFFRLKQMVERAGGQIEVDSGRAKFTTFTLKIPYVD